MKIRLTERELRSYIKNILKESEYNQDSSLDSIKYKLADELPINVVSEKIDRLMSSFKSDYEELMNVVLPAVYKVIDEGKNIYDVSQMKLDINLMDDEISFYLPIKNEHSDLQYDLEEKNIVEEFQEFINLNSGINSRTFEVIYDASESGFRVTILTAPSMRLVLTIYGLLSENNF